jgi:DNA-directed RNA polymerase subunit RPC12/RpoP
LRLFFCFALGVSTWVIHYTINQALVFLIFIDEELVNNHLEKTFDANGYTLWRCQACQYASKYKFNVTEHVKIRHLQLLDYVQCPHCAQECATKNSLRSHIWRLHKLVQSDPATR